MEQQSVGINSVEAALNTSHTMLLVLQRLQFASCPPSSALRHVNVVSSNINQSVWPNYGVVFITRVQKVPLIIQQLNSPPSQLQSNLITRPSLNMAIHNKGMNKILLNEESIEDIRNDPAQAVESFAVYNGSGIEGRDHDIPTAQNMSNGVILYHTPAPAPAPGPRRSTRRRKRAADDEGGHDRVSPRPRGANPGLGALDMLPVSPQVILAHGGNRGMVAAAFVEFAKGIARNFSVLTFQKDRNDAEDAVDKRVAAFNYLQLDAFKTCRALGGRSRGARCAVRASKFEIPPLFLFFRGLPLFEGLFSQP